MVQNVEHFPFEFHGKTFRKLEILEYAHVELCDSGLPQDIAGVSDLPGGRRGKCSCIEVRVLAVGDVVIVIVQRTAIVNRDCIS